MPSDAAPTVRHMDDAALDPYRENGPGWVVDKWLQAFLFESSWEEAWQLMERPLRLYFAQVWISSNAEALAELDHDELAEAITDAPDEPHELWATFAQVMLDHHKQAYSELSAWDDIDNAHDVLLLTDGLEAVQVSLFKFSLEPSTVQGFSIVMRRTADGWTVAGLGNCLPEPGWPPMLGPRLDGPTEDDPDG